MPRVWLSFIFLIIFALFVRPVFAETIKLNEFYSSGTTTANPDWIEIYYDGIDPNLYQLKDESNNTKDLADTNCGDNFCTVDWFSRLNNDGDTIRLLLTSSPDSPVDQVNYGSSKDIISPEEGQSAGRNIDGTGTWVIFSTPSKGSSNNSSSQAPTPTPTSEPTPTLSPTPTLAPTSTKTPTPSKTPTPTSKPSPTSTPKATRTPTTANSDTAKPNLPPSILGTNSAQITITETPDTKTQIAAFSFKNILIFSAVAILILSGILTFTFIAKKKLKAI